MSSLLLLILFLSIPRFFKKYWEIKVKRIFKRKHANLPLPLPWIWKNNIPQLQQFKNHTKIFIQLLFTLIPLVYLSLLSLFIFTEAENISLQDWAVIASASFGLFYFHHVTSRADFSHLAQVISPFFITLALLSNNTLWGTLILLIILIFSFYLIYWIQKNSLREVFFPSNTYVKFPLGKNYLYLTAGQHKELSNLQDFIEKYSKPQEAVLIVPTLVTLYPLFKRKTALYDVFCVYPSSHKKELEMIEEIKFANPPLAIVQNNPLDGKEELRFMNTHPKIWKYLNQNYNRETTEVKLNPNFYLFRLITKKENV